MSGGYFDYKQYDISDVAEKLEYIIKTNNQEDEYGYCLSLSKETIKEFEFTIKQLRLASVYLNRVDWLISGDDNEVDFHKRLKEDLKEYKLI